MIKNSIKFISVIFIVILISLYFDYQKFLNTSLNINTSLIFTIDSGSSFKDLNKKLESYHILDKLYYFEFYARHTGYAKKIQSGEYQLSPGLTPTEIINMFVSGDVVQYSITLVEGWTYSDIFAEIYSNKILVKKLKYSSQEAACKSLWPRYGHFYPCKFNINSHIEKKAHYNVEGAFFPDTYYFTKGTSDIELLDRAHSRLVNILEMEWEARDTDLPYKDSYEALIMASIIEKETALVAERSKISGVFVRRLKNNMKLQTDPTVIYAMGEKYDGNIRKKDLNIDSSYNTYRYKGLPPTPIALAGREAIHAALHPENDDALYFVAKKDGSHHFSKTLDEHNEAVQKYQLNK
jgi:UPF0755 protein